MKSGTVRLLLLFFLSWLQCHLDAQLSFSLPPSACVNSTLALSANTGTLAAPQITWLSSPNAIFSNTVSANTSISFTAAGSYSILLVVISGTNLAFTQNTIQVYSNPTPTLSSIPSSVCPNTTFTLNALLPPMGIPGFTFALPGNSVVSTGSTPTLTLTAPSQSAFPGIYSVSVEVAGCSGSSSLAVHQLSLFPLIYALPSSVICPGFGATLTAIAPALSNYTFSVLSPSPATFPNGSSSTIAVSPTQASLYHVLVDSANCTGSATLNLSIGPPLNLNASVSSVTTCIMSNFPKLSQPITLYATGASSYTWVPYNPSPGPFPTPGFMTVRPQQNTCYTVTGTTAVCSGSAVICVTVTPQFSVAISPSSSSICLGQTLTLISGSLGPGAVGSPTAYVYFWTEAPNSPPISMSSYYTATTNVFPQNSTIYTLEVIDTHSCISLPQVASVTVLACTGIDEVNTSEYISLLPNPAIDYCELKSTGKPIQTVELLDLTGKIHSRNSFEANESAKLELRSLTSGCYILKVFTSDGKVNYLKLIKQE